MKINYRTVRNFIVANIAISFVLNVGLEFLSSTLDKFLLAMLIAWVVALILLMAAKGVYDDVKE